MHITAKMSLKNDKYVFFKFIFSLPSLINTNKLLSNSLFLFYQKKTENRNSWI